MLSTVPPLSEAEEKHCISIICFLAGDACNRAKIRMSGAFTRIVEIAKNTKCNMVLTMILIGLQSFKYDNISIDLMIKIGLVNVLVERLDLSTRDLSETHVVKRVSKRSNFDVDAVAVGTTGDDGDDDQTAEEMPASSKRMKLDFYRSRVGFNPIFSYLKRLIVLIYRAQHRLVISTMLTQIVRVVRLVCRRDARHREIMVN